MTSMSSPPIADGLLRRHGGLIRSGRDTTRMSQGAFRCPHCGRRLTTCSPAHASSLPLWHQDLEHYVRQVGKHGIPHADRPKQCPRCGQSDRMLHRHSHFTRGVRTLSRRVSIFIFRFRCPECTYVHSVIPAFLEPYQVLDLDVQEDLIEAVERGGTVGAVTAAFEALTGEGLEAHTVASFVRSWNERLTQLESGLWPWLLEQAPHLTLTPPTSSLWRRLHGAWQSLRGQVAVFRDIRFLQGLNRLSFSLAVTAHGP